MNINACEFVPQHKDPVVDRIHDTLLGIVADYFSKSKPNTLDQEASKLVMILDHQRKLAEATTSPCSNFDANGPVAKAIVALTISRTNGLVAGMPYIKQICSHLPDDAYNSLMNAIINQIYLSVHSDKVKSSLLKMSEGESLNFKDEPFPSTINNQVIDGLPIYVPELMNLIIALIPFMFEKRRVSQDRLIGPNQLCMDLLYISDCVFRLQMQNIATQTAKELAVNASINGDEGKPDRANLRANLAKKQGITEWYEFFCLICEAISKAIPVVNYLLLSASESLFSGAWFHSASLSSRQDVLRSKINECAFFTVQNLSSLFEAAMTRLRELIVQPDSLTKWHARSAALDTLLIAASVPSLPIPSGDSSDVMENEEPSEDYTEDFEKFLSSMSTK